MFKDIRYYDYYFRTWDPKVCQYKVSSITNVLVVYVRNYHKLNDLKHQFIIIIAHDIVGQEFQPGLHRKCSSLLPMSGSPLGLPTAKDWRGTFLPTASAWLVWASSHRCSIQILGLIKRRLRALKRQANAASPPKGIFL